MNPTEDIVLDLKRLSERTCLSVRWLRDYIKIDHPQMIPHSRVGGKILIRWSEFLKWLEGFRVEGNFAEIQKNINSTVFDLKSKDRLPSQNKQ
jgi:hypothetical protein